MSSPRCRATLDLRALRAHFALTNRLRTEGTDHLLAAGRAVGIKRFVAQSFAGWPSARTGGPVKTEDDPLDPDARRADALDARRDPLPRGDRHRRRAGREGIVLRYGGFYGPGTDFSLPGRRHGRDDPQAQVPDRRRRRRACGRSSTSRTPPSATVEAIEHGRRGIYNVVDDEPAPVARVAARRWRPRVGARKPRRVPRWIGRIAAGEAATVMMTEVRGRVERQGEARARLEAALRELAAGLRGGARLAVEASFEELRPRAFAIAYRMLGSVSEAEDVVQEALLRLHRASGGERIESPRAYLSTVVTRLAIDQLRSARVRRETYVGEWLPEPLLAEPESDPARQAEMADSLSLAFLVLLETLSPEQRAVFLLREVFDYPYDADRRDRRQERGRTSASSRRGRAGTSTSGGRASRPRASSATSSRDRFFAAAQEGDLDGARGAARRGRRAARRRRRQGAGAGARAVRPIARGARRCATGRGAAPRIGGVSTAPRRRQRPARRDAARPRRRVISVMALDIADGQIQGIRSIVNPDKLHLARCRTRSARGLAAGATDKPIIAGVRGREPPAAISPSMLWAMALSAPVTVRAPPRSGPRRSRAGAPGPRCASRRARHGRWA